VQDWEQQERLLPLKGEFLTPYFSLKEHEKQKKRIPLALQ
jgi:hypothetical protein